MKKASRGIAAAGAIVVAALAACSESGSAADPGGNGGSGAQSGSAGGGGKDAGAGGSGGSAGSGGVASGGSGGAGGSGGTAGAGGGAGSGSGGTGGSGGSAGAGGQGGSGGGQCVEHTPGEITQLCQGKCAYELKCDPQALPQTCQGQPGTCIMSSSQYAYGNPYAYCDDSQWTPQSPPPTLGCAGCQRQGPPGACSFGSARSFEYVCDPQRSNGIQDFDETDVDCGGRAPVKCGVGGSCLQNSDCELQACVNSVCANASNAPAGCAFKPNSTTICCPKSVDGWYRLATIDSGCPVNTFAFKNDGAAPAPPGCSANQIDPASVCCSTEFP